MARASTRCGAERHTILELHTHSAHGMSDATHTTAQPTPGTTNEVAVIASRPETAGRNGQRSLENCSQGSRVNLASRPRGGPGEAPDRVQVDHKVRGGRRGASCLRPPAPRHARLQHHRHGLPPPPRSNAEPRRRTSADNTWSEFGVWADAGASRARSAVRMSCALPCACADDC